MLALATELLRAWADQDGEDAGETWVSCESGASRTELTARVESFQALVRASSLRGLTDQEQAALARLTARLRALLGVAEPPGG
jgi:hypothetical protein